MSTKSHTGGLDLGNWTRRINGYYTLKELTLTSPIVTMMFQRSFIQIQRELYYLLTFAPYAVRSKEQVDELHGMISKTFADASSQIENKIMQLQQVAMAANIAPVTGATQQARAEVPVTSPQAQQVLDIFIQADAFHSNLTAAWIAGEVPNEDRLREEENMKKVLRSVIYTTKNTYRQAMRKASANEQQVPEELRPSLKEAAKESEENDAIEDHDVLNGGKMLAEILGEAPETDKQPTNEAAVA